MQYRGLELDAFQQQAIASLEAGRSVLVSAPTGTGKTIIADWIVDEALSAKKRVIYTAPVKALSNQKFRDYCRLYGEDRVGLVTGDLVIRRDAPCLVMTTEILRNMLLGGENLDDLRAVILDEIHFLDDRERGTTWEEVLIYLPQHVQIVGLSATLSNLDEFSAWLSHVRGGPVDVVTETKRTVPLRFFLMSSQTGVLDADSYDKAFKRQGTREPERGAGRGRGRDRDRGGRGGRGGRTSHIDCFHAVDDMDILPYLYFVFSRKDTELYARALSRHLHRSLLDANEQARIGRWLDNAAPALGPALDADTRALYEKGIAFHHAGLHVQLKALVEELYEQKLIKVLYCTSTFALGINLPARSVVFDGVKKYDGRSVSPLSTRGFMQKAGRAGRRGMDEVGYVVIKLDFQDYEEIKPVLERYRKGAYEPVRSSFNLSWNSVVNLLGTHDHQRIREILDKSFLAWHLARQAEEHLRKADDASDKEARKLRQRAEQAENRTWSEFERKVGYLQDIGYLADDSTFNAGAKILRYLQMSEIPVAELILDGVFEGLPATRLFGVLCGLTNELPRHCERSFRIDPDDRVVATAVRSVITSRAVMGAEELTASTYAFDPDLVHLGRCWAEGTSLQDLLQMVRSETDISGDLITGFRRAKDLAGQLVDVYRTTDPDRADDLRDLVRKVSRDEVEVVD